MIVLGVFDNGSYGFFLPSINGNRIPEISFMITDDAYNFLKENTGIYSVDIEKLPVNITSDSVLDTDELTKILVIVEKTYTPPPKSDVELLHDKLLDTQVELDETKKALQKAKDDNVTALDAIAQIYEQLLDKGLL